MQSTGTRRTTIYTTPGDRTRLAELVRHMTLSEPAASQGYSMSEAIRTAVEYTLRYGYGIGEGEDQG
jgi:hypothetical protein